MTDPQPAAPLPETTVETIRTLYTEPPLRVELANIPRLCDSHELLRARVAALEAQLWVHQNETGFQDLASDGGLPEARYQPHDEADHCACLHDGRGELTTECQEHQEIRERCEAAEADARSLRETLRDVLSRWAPLEIIDAVDDDMGTGIRPCPPNGKVTITDVRRWHAVLTPQEPRP